MLLNRLSSSMLAALDLQFLSDAGVDSRITYSGGAGGTYTDSTGTIRPQRANLGLWSADQTNGVWGTTTGVTVSPDTNIAPDGTATADSLTFAATTSYRYQTLAVGSSIAGRTYTVSAWLWSPSGKASIGLRFCGSVTGTDQASNNVALTSVPTRVSVTRTFTSTDTSIFFGLDNRVADAGDGLAGTVVVWGLQIEPGSIATPYIPTTSAAVYAPRIDFNPTTHAALGVLVEEQRTNLIPWASDMTQAAWSKSNATVTANATTAPDGTATAQKLVEDSATAPHYAFETATVTAGNPYTVSRYFKASDRTWAWLYGHQATEALAYFDLTNGVVGTQSGTAAGRSATITNAGNGWWRCTLTWTPSTPDATSGGGPTTSNGVLSYAGDGTSGIYVWGAQLEAGSFSTSYIPTTSAAVTRTADTSPIDATPFWNSGAGTYLFEFDKTALVPVGLEHDLMQVTGTGIQVFLDSAGSYIKNTKDNLQVVGSGLLSVNTPHKLAAAYSVAENSYRGCVNGGAIHADSTQTPPATTALNLGQSGAFRLNGHIKRVRYWRTRLPDATMQALTT